MKAPPLRPLLVYTAARMLVLLASFALFYAVGARGLLLVALSGLVSGLVSYLAFARQRDALAGRLEARVQRARQRIEDRAAAEDEADERARSQGDAPEP